MDRDQHVELCVQALEDGRFDEALTHVRAAQRLAADEDPGLHFLQGVVLTYLGQWKQAIRALDVCLRLDPGGASVDGERAAILRYRGLAAFPLQRYAEAADDLSEVVRNDEEDWEACHTLGVCLLLLGEDADALAWFEAAHRAQPEHPASAIQIAYVLACSPIDELRDGPRARAIALEVTQAEGRGNWSSLSVLAATHAECGDFEAAVAVARDALEMAPEPEKRRRRERLEQYLRGEPSRIEDRERRKTFDPNE